MNDKIVGRPIRLNKQVFKPKNGYNYVEIVFLGDVHYGSPQCDIKRFLGYIKYCYENDIYVLLMGDLVECATRHSVGAGVYEQEVPAQSQHEQMIEWLRPLSDNKLIIGSLRGNHEMRTYNESGVDVSKALARELDVPFLGDACWNQFRVGDECYSVYSLHGRSGSRFDGTALLAVERISTSFFCDLVVHGHSHKCIDSIVVMQQVKNNQVVEHKKFLLITGSFLKYDGGYGQMTGLPISKLGAPKVKFFCDKHDLSITW